MTRIEMQVFGLVAKALQDLRSDMSLPRTCKRGNQHLSHRLPQGRGWPCIPLPSSRHTPGLRCRLWQQLNKLPRPHLEHLSIEDPPRPPKHCPAKKIQVVNTDSEYSLFRFTALFSRIQEPPTCVVFCFCLPHLAACGKIRPTSD